MDLYELRKELDKEYQDLHNKANRTLASCSKEISFLRRTLDYTFKIIANTANFIFPGIFEGCEPILTAHLQMNNLHAEEFAALANPISEKANAERSETGLCSGLKSFHGIGYAGVSRYTIFWIAMKIWLFIENVALKVTGNFKKSSETLKAGDDKYLESPYLEASNHTLLVNFLTEYQNIKLEFYTRIKCFKEALENYNERNLAKQIESLKSLLKVAAEIKGHYLVREAPVVESMPKNVSNTALDEESENALVKNQSGMENLDAMPSSEPEKNEISDMSISCPLCLAEEIEELVQDAYTKLLHEKDVAMAASTEKAVKATLNKDKPTSSVVETTKIKGTETRSVTFDVNVKQNTIPRGVIVERKRVERSTKRKGFEVCDYHYANQIDPRPKDKVKKSWMYLLFTVKRLIKIIQELETFGEVKEFMLQLGCKIALGLSGLFGVKYVWSTLCDLKLKGNQRTKDLFRLMVQIPDYIIPPRKVSLVKEIIKEMASFEAVTEFMFQLANEIALWSSELFKLKLIWSTLCHLKLKGVTVAWNIKEIMESGPILQICFSAIVTYAYELSYSMLDMLKATHFAQYLLRLIQIDRYLLNGDEALERVLR